MRQSSIRFTQLLALHLLVAGLLSGAAPAAELLRSEPSAFVRANLDSPVEWMPWGDAAFARVRQEHKPVFLFLGSFTSELSRAMRRQTFSNPETARMLNQNFVCVLVDIEEHPELAALYRAYLSDVKQLKGLPMNLWLTPDWRPFEGGTYLPPTEEWGKASFSKIAGQALQAWTSDPAACRKRAGEAVAALLAEAPVAPEGPVTPEKTKARLASAAAAWIASADPVNAGFGDAPKSAEPEVLRFLLAQGPTDRAVAVSTLRAIAASPMRDPLDGGFFHSSADAAWRVPNPQKWLTDQARLALALLDAAQGADAAVFADAARGALDYALNRLIRPDGTFAATEDATADEFADYYPWTQAELIQVLGTGAELFNTRHGVVAGGNVPADFDLGGHFKGKNLLSSVLASDAADATAAARLLVVRDRRPALPRDERATAGAHGLMLAALARAGEVLDEPRYRAAAAHTFAVIQREFLLTPAGDLRRFRGSALPAAPEDYAAVALGCREFARTAHHKEALALADTLLARATSLYLPGGGGHFYAVPTALPEGIWERPLADGDPLSAESLALLAGLPPAQARPIVSALSGALETDDKPAGDGLLALSRQP
jgi:uncharacterized protein YyaL (SSP411 family)